MGHFHCRFLLFTTSNQYPTVWPRQRVDELVGGLVRREGSEAHALSGRRMLAFEVHQLCEYCIEGTGDLLVYILHNLVGFGANGTSHTANGFVGVARECPLAAAVEQLL
jgi:hypothetical protein